MFKQSLITTFKVMLLKGVHAEEESILDQAAVLNSYCSSSWCINPQLVIGRGFKSRFSDNSNPNGD